ncbi:MAG: NADH-quinone oxidoreductase subunit NuoB [Clostridia bacterium]|nr:NADH-quinone oxidoreductase subunit NuoB [Clostridia bacterium]
MNWGDVRAFFQTKSPWAVWVNACSCDGCDAELLPLFTPYLDVERFGILLKGSPRHGDILFVTGPVNYNMAPILQRVYEQMPEPKVVVASGSCACSGGAFRDCFNIIGGVDKVIPVDVYVPGCPHRPDGVIHAAVQALGILAEKSRRYGKKVACV